MDPFLHFLQQVREVIEGNAGRPESLVCRVAELLDAYINEQEITFEGDAEPGCRFGELLYEDLRTGFVVVLMSWGGGSTTTVHEHTTWDVFGVLKGRLRVRNFLREGDGEPNLVAEFVATPGDVTYLIPPEQAIHQLLNPDPELALSLHVYESNQERTYGDQPEG